MKFTIEIAVSLLMFTAFAAHAQNPPKPVSVTVVTDSKLFCKVEEFIVKGGPAAAAKKCAGLVEQADQPVKGAESCKEHGLAKGRECVKLSKAKKLQVKLKFTEQLGANKNFSMWTCELDDQGGSACP